MDALTCFIPDEEDMLAWGARLARGCDNKPAVIFLHGQLGAGKTTLVRGFLRSLGYRGAVKSPSYALVEPYELENIIIFHFDLYRVQQPEELEFIGIHDYFSLPAIFLIEWPEQGNDLLPVPDLSCYIQTKAEGREIRIMTSTEHGNTILSLLR